MRYGAYHQVSITTLAMECIVLSYLQTLPKVVLLLLKTRLFSKDGWLCL
jgi:hypothetical protein